MNFKIENIVLSITNYPSVERHLEEMAGQGWMLKRMLFSHIFIYAKVDPRQVDFNIVPFPNETFLEKKSKEDIEEFKDTNAKLGWEYSSRAGDFHVYFKDKGAQAQDIIASEREEFELLEKISKTQKMSSYFVLIIFAFLYYTSSKDFGTSVNTIKSAAGQILIGMTFFAVSMSIIDIVSIFRFLKKNRKNISSGEPLEFKAYKFTFQKISFVMIYIIGLLFLAYILYSVIVFKDQALILSLIPVLSGSLVGIFLRFFVKPSKKIVDYKVIIYILSILLVLGMMRWLVYPRIIDLDQWKSQNDIDLQGYRVLEVEDFKSRSEKNRAKLTQDISFLAPRSYVYINKDGSTYIKTDYSRTLNASIAKNLVKRYKKEEEERIDNWYNYELEQTYRLRRPSKRLKEMGLSSEELEPIYKEELDDFKKKAIEKMKEKAISNADKKVWNVDQAYYLDYNKESIVLRNGKEVYVLSSIDFSDDNIRRIVMDKLGLD